MKCGIITFHRAINYGAVLQAYALNRFISSNFDANCELIDYRCESIENIYRIKGSNLNPQKAIKKVLANRKKRKFDAFVKNNISTSVSLTKENLPEAEKDYDVIIAGSDQVWEKSMIGKDESYFLDFVKDGAKKASYAASMGSGSIDDNDIQNYRRLLEDFTYISLREKEASESLSRILNRKTIASLDPTLLLNKEEWLRVASGRFKNKKYVLIYTMTNSSHVIEHAKRVAKERGLSIYHITDSYHNIAGIKNLRHISPEDWVDAFMNASYVVTNSFHGTAFSINLGVDFNSEVSKGLEKRGTRITDLLELLNLSDRLLNDSDTTGKMDFSVAHKILNEERQKSADYLADVLAEKRKE